MEKLYICGGNKYTISVVNNTIALPVILENLPSEVTIEGSKLLLKPSFHVSLVCINEIIKKHKVKIPEFEGSVLKDFCEFTKTNDIQVLEYGGFRYSEKDILKTVIVECEVSNLLKFFEILNKNYQLNIEYPPTHVTLYAHDGKSGIFTTDSDDLKNLTKIIPNPIGRNL